MNGDDEEERQRQRRERAALDPSDRLYGKRPGDLRGNRRRGRVVQMSLRMQLKVRAILEHIMQRDAHDGLPGLFEIMLKLYLEKHGGVDEADLPTIDALVERYLSKQDEKDGQ